MLFKLLFQIGDHQQSLMIMHGEIPHPKPLGDSKMTAQMHGAQLVRNPRGDRAKEMMMEEVIPNLEIKAASIVVKKAIELMTVPILKKKDENWSASTAARKDTDQVIALNPRKKEKNSSVIIAVRKDMDLVIALNPKKNEEHQKANLHASIVVKKDTDPMNVLSPRKKDRIDQEEEMTQKIEAEAEKKVLLQEKKAGRQMMIVGENQVTVIQKHGAQLLEQLENGELQVIKLQFKILGGM